MKAKHILPLALVFLIQACSDDDDGGSVNQPNSTVQLSSSDLIEGGEIFSTVNPSGIAPLTAEIEFRTKFSANTEITVLGEVPIHKTFETNSKTHKIPVLGLYGGTENQVVLKITTANGFSIDTVLINTDSISSLLPDIEINTKNLSLMEKGMNLNTLSLSDGTNFQPYPLIYDHRGDIRWYLNFEGIYPGFVAPFERVGNGNILFETGKFIKEYDMMGREQKSIAIPAEYTSHHDVVKLPNGNYLVAVNKSNVQVMINGSSMNSVEDFMVELDGNTGAVVEEWDFRKLLDVNRDDVLDPVSGSVADWFHMNAVYYSASDDAFIVSGRNQGLVKVGRNNELKWIMAPQRGWGKAGFDGSGDDTKPFLLTAVNGSGTPYDSLIQNGTQNDPDFDWTWGQHAPLILPNGNLLVFDNGFNRQFGNASADYSRAVEYEIDENQKTVEQIWAYGESRGGETFSSIISDVDYLPETGNVLFAPGIHFGLNYSKIVEVTRPGGTVVFEGTMHFKDTRSSGGGFGQFEITYRAERLSLYP